jgi:phospho-N-acetylmuramoyl-pentapeptide-transferase
MVRALVIGSAAMGLATVLGAPLIAELRRRGLGKAISSEGPESHLSKAGTPTMGGMLVLLVVAAVTIPTNLWSHPSILLPLLVMAGAAAVGFADDLLTIQGRERIGGHERGGLIAKALLGAGLGLVVGLIVYFGMDRHHVFVPHYGAYQWSSVLLVAAAIVVVAGTTSAVAISDGLDGLLGGLLVLSYGAYGVIAAAQDDSHIAVFCLTVAGAIAGFLWYNAYPASVFMGETGALPLGAGLATVALMTGWWLLLLIIGAVFVAEALSDIVQIGSFQLRGKRLLRMAPLHHHFELSGWAETQVVTRFWLVGAVGAALGVALALTG